MNSLEARYGQNQCKFGNMLIKAIASKNPRQVCRVAGYSPETIKRWLARGQSGGIHAVEDILNACGYELVMRKIDGGGEHE
jgi:DNA-binding phage protein